MSWLSTSTPISLCSSTLLSSSPCKVSTGSVREVISRSKFTEQIFSPVAEPNFLIHRYKIFLPMCMRKQIMNIYQATMLFAKFFHRHEPTLAEDHACLRQCGWSHRHRPAADSCGLRLWLPPCTRTSTHKGYARWAWKLSAQSHYGSIQHSRNAHHTNCQLYRH